MLSTLYEHAVLPKADRASRMTTAEKIMALAESQPGISASQVAAELGISRQRVYSACRLAGIKLKSAYPVSDRRNPAHTPKPRVITGGVETPISHTVCGSISEILTAADLMARGYKPYMPIVRQRSHDIIAVTPSGAVITVEVRSGKPKASGHGYTFGPKCADMISMYYAIVITGRPVEYRPDLPE